MRLRVLFDGRMYIKHMWTKYLGACLGFTVITCFLMLLNGTLSVMAALAVGCFFFITSVLVLINRIRTWSGSTVSLHGEGVTYERIMADGLTDGAAGGREKRVLIYDVARIKRATITSHGICIHGNVSVTDIRYAGHKEVRKRTLHTDRLVIPSYFADWDRFIAELACK